MRSLIDRASSTDLMQLAAEVGPVPQQIGAVLVLGAGDDSGEAGAAAPPDLSAVRAALAVRSLRVPRLRARLRPTPPGCGRPVWVDDPAFDITRHVQAVRCPGPADTRSLLRVASDELNHPLPRSRPLWSATLVTGLADGRTALVVVIHHVLADGLGGLAVLRHLADDPPEAPAPPWPRPAPDTRELFADAWRTRAEAVRHPGQVVRQLRAAVAELRPRAAVAQLRPRAGQPAGRTSLNRPTGPSRRLGICRADLAEVRAAAHAADGTVNDVVLTAVTGALATVLRRRGESPTTLVASVPVSARASDDAGALGNQVGVAPVGVPVAGRAPERLRAVARLTRQLRPTRTGASAALMAPTFRLLRATGLMRPLMDHQRLVSTFVTDVRGPSRPLRFLGRPVEEVWPLSVTLGNVPASFAALSYAGRLTVSVLTDPVLVPESDLLTSAVQAGIDELVTAGAPRGVRGALAEARTGVRRLSPAEARDAAARGALLVDTRTESQRRDQGELPGALVIDRTVLEWRLDPASPTRIPEAAGYDVEVVVVCSEGYSSSLAAASLRRIGLHRATDLVGGAQAWRAAGLPMSEGPADVRR